MATAPSPNDLTRQQLDELDALLQRMLSLPLNPPEAAPEPPVKNWRMDPPAPVPIPAPHLLAAPLPPEPPPPPLPVTHYAPPAEAYTPYTPPAPVSAPVSRMPVPEPEPPFALPEPAPMRVVTAPPRVSRGTPSPAAPAVTPGPVDVMVAPPPPIREAVAFPLWPLVGLNWLVDSLLGLFGPPGRLLRSGFMKNILGVAGLALLLYTAAKVAQQQGWITLPIALPWPPKI